jgi:hypothetical protein
MSVLDERDLGERLSTVLDAITPSAPPAGVTLRSGKLIRARRNIAITAGLAVAAGLVVSAPGLLHKPARGASSVRPTVMVRQLCPAAPRSARGPAGQLELVAGRAAGLPATEVAAGRCAWLMP